MLPMRRISRFLHLRPAEQRLFVRALFLVGAIRLGLSLVPFQTLRRVVARMAAASPKARQSDHTREIPWAVAAASRLVPNASCLTQALAVQVLLGRGGQQSRLRIGVATGEEGRLKAHAWVESQGRVVIGDSGLEHFTLLPAIEME